MTAELLVAAIGVGLIGYALLAPPGHFYRLLCAYRRWHQR